MYAYLYSDTTYKSISSALEMQRSVRMSHFHGGERQIVEYERNSVARRTQVSIVGIVSYTSYCIVTYILLTIALCIVLCTTDVCTGS